MFALAVVLIARKPFVPGNLVLQAHFKGTFVAIDVWLCVLEFIDKLSAVTAFTEAPAEVGVGGKTV
jgi:hypothetical protein